MLDCPHLCCNWLGVFDSTGKCARSSPVMAVTYIMIRYHLNAKICLTSKFCGSLFPVFDDIYLTKLSVWEQLKTALDCCLIICRNVDVYCCTNADWFCRRIFISGIFPRIKRHLVSQWSHSNVFHFDSFNSDNNYTFITLTSLSIGSLAHPCTHQPLLIIMRLIARTHRYIHHFALKHKRCPACLHRCSLSAMTPLSQSIIADLFPPGDLPRPPPLQHTHIAAQTFPGCVALVAKIVIRCFGVVS